MPFSIGSRQAKISQNWFGQALRTLVDRRTVMLCTRLHSIHDKARCLAQGCGGDFATPHTLAGDCALSVHTKPSSRRRTAMELSNHGVPKAAGLAHPARWPLSSSRSEFPPLPAGHRMVQAQSRLGGNSIRLTQ